ncbi:zinc finger domain-containing protein [Canibacter zhuwentaonis]
MCLRCWRFIAKIVVSSKHSPLI